MPAATSRLPCRSAILRLSSGIIQTGPFRRLFSAPATAFAGRIRCYRAERGIGRYFFFAKNRYLSGYVFQVLHRVAVVVAAAGVRSGAGDGAAYRPPPRSASRCHPPESGGPETGLALRQRLISKRRDSLRRNDSLRRQAEQRNQRLYDSIRSKTTRRAVPRLLYRMLFVNPVLDTTANGRVLDESRQFERYSGRRIGEVVVAAGSGVHPRRQLARTHGQQTAPHDDARAGAAARPALRTRGYDRSGAAGAQPPAAPFARLYLGCRTSMGPTPDSLDSTRVVVTLRSRDRWTDQRRCGAARRGPDDDRSTPTPTSSARATA